MTVVLVGHSQDPPAPRTKANPSVPLRLWSHFVRMDPSLKVGAVGGSQIDISQILRN